MIATQLFVGSREMRDIPVSRMEETIRAARDIAGIDALAIWPCEDPALLKRLAGTARACGVQTYLWFPLLADPPGRAAAEKELVVHSDGGRGNGRTGAWEGLHGGEESFLFACPNSSGYLDAAFASYRALIDRMQPDGVMLDRIRFPSPANGFEALFSCFCPACEARFEAETGRPLSAQRDRARAFLGKLAMLDSASFAAEWRSTDTLWSAAGLADFAAFRARSILRVAGRFAGHARSLGMKVGLDMYSPRLAELVGQDYRALAGICDWMKPMSYCRAVGPAGLPLEVACMWRALRQLCPRLDERGAGGILRALLGWEIPESERELLEKGLPARTIAAELETIRGFGLPPQLAIYAGIEAVRNPVFRIDITADILEAGLAQARGRCQGIVASWNLLYIPRDNLARIGAIEA